MKFLLVFIIAALQLLFTRLFLLFLFVCFGVLRMMTSTIKVLKNRDNIKTIKKSTFIFCDNNELDLKKTLKGGQSFRWTECKDGKGLRGVFSSTVCTLLQNDNKLIYTIHGSLKEELSFDKVLYDYFRLDLSLTENLKIWTNVDSHFESYNKIGAVRILNQDVIENLFSFICSSNNNVTRISGMVDKLCRIFGKMICKFEDYEYYDFPTIEALSEPHVESVLRKEGFGYRAGYISKSAQKLLTLGGKKWLLELQKNHGASYKHARESLMSLPGIGPKVADCICLMSLGHLEAIPVDTHIFQIACANYIPHLNQKKGVTPKIHHEVSSYLYQLWGPLAGWAQAIVFCMRINSNETKGRKRSICQDKKSSIKIKNLKQLKND